MKKIFIAGAVIISAMAFASSNNAGNVCSIHAGVFYNDTTPKKQNKKDTMNKLPKDTAWPKKDTMQS